VAIVIRKKVVIDGGEIELKTYQPSGQLSKKEREQANRLDDVLKVRIPALAQQLVKFDPKEQGVVRRWYVLGQKLRALVDDPSLVSSSDVSSGLVWQAIWYYLPDLLRPASSSDTEDYSDKQHKRKDHLSLCYEISAFPWDEVCWIQRWDDWHQLAFRPGLLRDHRIIHALGKSVSALKTYPTREKFRNTVKRLGDAFPTRHHRDSSLLSGDVIEKVVAGALDT
jgi:hypothetical protein